MQIPHAIRPRVVCDAGDAYDTRAGRIAAVSGSGSVFEAAAIFTRAEGILPAPESAHAIKAAIDEANAATQTGEEKKILFCLSGHGHFDLGAYGAFLGGKLEDHEFPEGALEKSLKGLERMSN